MFTGRAGELVMGNRSFVCPCAPSRTQLLIFGGFFPQAGLAVVLQATIPR